MNTSVLQPPAAAVRLKLSVRGAVQGVGFRPFVYRLATELGLCGWVNNSPAGVLIEVEGRRSTLTTFLRRLETEKPPHSSIQNLESNWLAPIGYDGFEIRESQARGRKTASVLPDFATCPDCLREMLDPQNRRYRYPFTNCTHCGPRFSIIEALPYDRANTSMKKFKLCPRCQAEYEDPQSRRFHAQPNACPICGPRLELWSATGENIFGGDEALLAAAQMIRRGKIVAVKGLGGFHLIADARNEKTIQSLRVRKQREEKPLALMFPSISGVRTVCEVSPLEENLLRSSEAPIVLLRKIANRKPQIANSVAPGNPNLGVMLPSNPLHHLLLLELGFPIVATSGNLSDEPICTDEREALERLRGIADAFLVHDRPIVRSVDDSIVRVMLGRGMILRRARGYAPLPVCLEAAVENPEPKVVLAVGAQLKNSVALAVGENVYLSQHLGDLETEAANTAFRRSVADLPRLYAATPAVIAADLHPDYLSTRFAHGGGNVVVGVQHHTAHVLACLAENNVELPALGVAWDGTGYGADGSIWGGEFFLVTENDIERIGHLRPFRLPGGEAAIRDPRRTAAGLLYEMAGEAAFACQELPTIATFSAIQLSAIKGMLVRQINSPFCSSVGRLFDAVASLINLRQQIRFEGQAAMDLEFALDGIKTDDQYIISLITHHSSHVLDWSPMIEAILLDVDRGVPAGVISARLHNALAESIVDMAKHFGQARVALSGGCFQNRYLTERTVTRLREEDFEPYWHQRVPTNDGGIAFGQVVAARWQLKRKNESCASQSREKSNASLVTAH